MASERFTQLEQVVLRLVREISAAYDNGGAHQSDLVVHEIAEQTWRDYPNGILHGKSWIFGLRPPADSASAEEKRLSAFARTKLLRPVLDDLTARGFLHQDPSGAAPGRVLDALGKPFGPVLNTFWPVDTVTMIGRLIGRLEESDAG